MLVGCLVAVAVFDISYGLAADYQGNSQDLLLDVYYPKLGIAAAMNINCDYAVGVLNMNLLMDSLVTASQSK